MGTTVKLIVESLTPPYADAAVIHLTLMPVQIIKELRMCSPVAAVVAYS